MTTIHAALPGATQPSAKYLSVTLQKGTEEALKLLAPREELQKALIETGGVGRFDLQIGADPTIHHAIACKVEKGPAPHMLRHLVVQEVGDSDVVRMQVMLRVKGMPPSVQEKQSQVVQRKRHLILRGPMSKLPEVVTVDLSELDADGVLTAGAIPLPDGVFLATPPDEEVFVVRPLVEA